MNDRLFNRLLKKADLGAGTTVPTPEQWSEFQALVKKALGEVQERQHFAENALAVSSMEMDGLYAELKTKSEAEAEDHNIFLATALDFMPTAVFCKDISRDFRYVIWNQSAEKMFGVKAASALNQTDLELFGPSKIDEIRQLDFQAIESQKVVSTPEELIISDGGTTVVRTHRVAVRDHAGKPRFVLGVAEDLTGERRSREILVQTARLASLGEMAGGIAHEINNPLAIIQGKSEFIKLMFDSGSPDLEKIRGFADDILKTCKRIGGIIKGMRMVSRNGERDEKQTEPLEKIVSDAIALCSEKFRTANVHLKAEFPMDFGMMEVECRQVQIAQILLNLLGNAFDAVGGSAESWVQVTIRQASDTVHIMVIDSGKGIPEAVRERMMQPFFTTKEVGKGTGLGLSISTRIALEHGGKLWYDDTKANTCFVLTLPIAKTTARTEPLKSAS